MIIQYVKIGILFCLRIILRIFYIVPINERKIVFASYGGSQYACSPKYIFEYIIKYYGDTFIFIWSLNKPNILPVEYQNIRTVRFLSFKYIYHFLTAGYIIYNSAVKSYLPFRKNQTIVNTWHGGGAYKKISVDALPYKKDFISMKTARKRTAKMVKYVISSCEKFTNVSSKVWAIPSRKFLPIGMPRNDIFFNMSDSIKKKVKDHFNLENNKKIVLYAPTFRGDYRNVEKIPFSLDISYLLLTLKNKFKHDFVFLYRYHKYYNNQSNIKNENIIPASNYPDMQELLCATDVLITDYSSSIWDFSFTFKPCFIYAPDVKKYQNEQGFYTPIEDWPFPLAETNEQLVGIINNFDKEKYIMAVKEHHEALGSYETGTAAKQLCDILFGDPDK
jgi:CDP-glycerol glycerophosphotransferase